MSQHSSHCILITCVHILGPADKAFRDVANAPNVGRRRSICNCSSKQSQLSLPCSTHAFLTHPMNVQARRLHTPKRHACILLKQTVGHEQAIVRSILASTRMHPICIIFQHRDFGSWRKSPRTSWASSYRTPWQGSLYCSARAYRHVVLPSTVARWVQQHMIHRIERTVFDWNVLQAAPTRIQYNA